MCKVINVIFYFVTTCAQWRMLPKEYPQWESVYSYFRQWTMDHTWQRIHNYLRARTREKAGRQKHPTAGSLDSQSVKPSSVPGVRGYDAGKHVMGKKRHILVDTLGLRLTVVVTAASVSDPAGTRQLFRRLGRFLPNLRKLWVDGTYRRPLLEWVEQYFRFHLKAVLPPKGHKGFTLLPRRWVVERTFRRFGCNRRLSKDYEGLTASSEAIVYIVMIRLMLRRLAHA